MRITKEMEKEIIEKYKKGIGAKDIACDLGIHWGTVYKILKTNNIPKRGKEPVFSAEQFDLVKNLYIEKRMTTEKVAKEMSVIMNKRITPECIQYWLRKENLTRQNGRTLFDFNHNYFESIDCERKAYFLGFIYADGCILEIPVKNHFRYTLSLEISKEDCYILEELKKDLNSDLKVKFVKKQSFIDKGYEKISETCYIRFHSKKLISDLKKLGCVPRKTGKLIDIPNIPSDLIPHFLRGYFDGNGSCGDWGRFSVSFYGSHGFLENIKQALIEKGVNSNSSVFKKNDYHSFLNYNHSQAFGFFNNYFYSNATIYLKRKKIKFDDYKNKHANTELTK